MCVWYCSFVWNKQFALVPRWLLSCHECFFFIMQDIVYHYWRKQFMMNINGNSLLQCSGKWKCKMYICHKLKSGGNTFNAFFSPTYCFAELTALLIPLLNWSYFGNTHNCHTKLYDILSCEENSTVDCNSKPAWLQWNLKSGKWKKRLDFKQVLPVSWLFLLKAVLPVIVQGFRGQQNYSAV